MQNKSNIALQREVDSLISEAVSYRVKEQFHKAKKVANDVLKISPKHEHAYFELALNYKGLGKNITALKYIDEYLKLDPDYFGALLIKSRLLFELGNHNASINFLDSNINKNLKATQWAIIGIIYTQLSKYEKSLTCFQKALEIDPENGDALCFKAFTLKRLGEKEEVREITEKLSKTAGNNVCYEKNLRDKIAADVTILNKFGHNLKLIEKEFKCKDRNGFIDILCEDLEKNQIVVIELKIETATLKTYQQIMNYIDSIQKTIGKEKNVMGMVISGLAEKDFEDAVEACDSIITHLEIEELGFRNIWFEFLTLWRNPEWYYLLN